jgi:hypothetical protein
MSHHVSAGASNPTGAVEVVRVASSATSQAPVDPGSAASSAGGNAPIATGGGAPVAQSSGTPGAQLPVDEINQASNTVQSAKADLSRTTGAERRLDGFDGVGGGGGGGGAAGAGGDAAAGDATVAAGTDQLDSEKLAEQTQQQGGGGAQLTSDALNNQGSAGTLEGNETQASSKNLLT